MDGIKEKINCFHCAHFFITWNEHFPHGCKAMGFKCKEMPSAVVFRNSGMSCQMFVEKKGHKDNGQP
ncbi:MAG: uracil-DNA glycosylase [Deltaproteobacteria bacterium]|nr:uracil-DNA glycosylase [Deltaproteobacteria bacterium]